MNKAIGIVTGLAVVVTLSALTQAAESQMPDWAYAIPIVAPPERPPEDGTLYSLPGTDRTFTNSQIRGRSPTDPNQRTPPADWYPGDHPPMPDIVANGDPSRGVVACALCHYPNGKGRPENASPAGLPKDYFVQQMKDFQDGLRESAEPRKNNYVTMINIAKGMSDEEIDQAAEYYSSMKWTKWVEVVEGDMVPKTWIRGGMHVRLEGDEAGMEPIGNRTVESPKNTEHTEALRDPRSGFIAYVPEGSVAKGEVLVTGVGAGKTIQCGICHGEDLNGLGTVPGIAARSPSYLVRQLYDIQQGKRRGNMAALMTPVVANLSGEDMINIAAYTASLSAPEVVPGEY